MAPPEQLVFPRLAARDLTGRDRELPVAFDGERNVVLVAFRREHQTAVDSWVPWLDAAAADDSGLRFYEVPTISDRWSPARRFIDGGMATSIGDPVVLRRTMTVYGDLRRLTDPLEITHRDDITVLLVDGSGGVRWRGSGPFDDALADQLAAALSSMSDGPAEEAVDVAGTQFPFAFAPQFRLPLALLGVTPGHAYVTVTSSELVVRFGPWSAETRLDNIADVCVTEGYRWHRAIGARYSLADGGATFGSNTDGGVCTRFVDPVPALAPFGLVRHPGLTVTVEDPAALAALLRKRISS